MRPPRVVEPCAGNFVISQVAGITLGENVEIISADVSSYSNAIGYGIMNKDVGIRMHEEYAKDYPMFAGYTDPAEIAAVVIVWAELSQFMGKRHIRYYDTLCRDIMNNAEMYIGKFRDKIIQMRKDMPNFDYRGQCATITMRDLKENDLVWFDPPHFSGDYEKMFANLDQCFTFPEVPFNEIDEDYRNDLLQEAIDAGAWVVTRPNHEIDVPGLEMVYRYEYKADTFYYLYSNRCSSAAQGRTTILREEDPTYDVLFKGERLDPDAVPCIHPMKSSHANHYRLMWTKKAKMKNMGDPYGVWIGPKLIGILQLGSGLPFSHDKAIIVADCTTTSTDYKRLSKLLLMLVLTQETLDMHNEKTMWTHLGFTTVAYTDAPVSMKYRGLFKKIKTESPSPSGHKNAITYQQDNIKVATWKEAYANWLRKHGDQFNA